MDYLPSKKFVLVLLAMGVVVLGVGAFQFLPKKTKEITQKKEDDKARAELLQQLQGDTDGDGLRDWEEILWKTDSQKNDTDGDGTSDHAELLANRDPLIPSPGDEIRTPHIEKTAQGNTVDATQEQNITATIAENFMKSYITRKFASSQDPSLFNTETLTADTLKDMQVALAQTATKQANDIFTKEDIHIGTDDSPQTIRAYINTTGSLVLSHNQKEENGKGVFVTALEALNKNDTASLQSLQEKAVLFASLSDKLRKDVIVPPSLAAAHLRFVNSFAHFSEITTRIANLGVDPIGGMAALAQYQQESARSLEALAATADAIKTYHFTFSEGEGGLVFAQYTDYQNQGS